MLAGIPLILQVPCHKQPHPLLCKVQLTFGCFFHVTADAKRATAVATDCDTLNTGPTAYAKRRDLSTLVRQDVLGAGFGSGASGGHFGGAGSAGLGGVARQSGLPRSSLTTAAASAAVNPHVTEYGHVQESSRHGARLQVYHAEQSSPEQSRAAFSGAGGSGSAVSTNYEGHQHAGSSSVSSAASNFVGRRLPTGYALPCAAGLMDTIREHVHSWVEDQNQVLLHASQENRRNFDEHANQISTLRGTIAANNRRIAELGGKCIGKCVRVCECVYV